MSLTLVSMCQRALRERATFSVPATIIDASNVTSIRLQMAADKTGRALRDLGGWQALVHTFDFVTVPGSFSYALPPDFRRFVGMTSWNYTKFQKIRGPITPEEWGRLWGQGSIAGDTLYWRCFGNSFQVYPIPVSADAIAYEYISTSWVRAPSELTASREYFASDNDTCVFDDDLMVAGIRERYQSIILGIDFEPSPEYDALIGARVSADGGSPVIDYGARITSTTTSDGNIPEGGW